MEETNSKGMWHKYSTLVELAIFLFVIEFIYAYFGYKPGELNIALAAIAYVYLSIYRKIFEEND